MTREELQKIAEKRMEALEQHGYTSLDSLYPIHEELRRIYGPGIIKDLEKLSYNKKELE